MTDNRENIEDVVERMMFENNHKHLLSPEEIRERARDIAERGYVTNEDLAVMFGVDVSASRLWMSRHIPSAMKVLNKWYAPLEDVLAFKRPPKGWWSHRGNRG